VLLFVDGLGWVTNARMSVVGQVGSGRENGRTTMSDQYSALYSSARVCACRFVGARAVRGERGAGGTDQGAAAAHSHVADPHRRTGAELRGVEKICRRAAISTH